MYKPQSLGIDPVSGKFSYPSSAGLGVEVIGYPLRGKSAVHEIQICKVPALVKDKLRQAHRQGHLREELNHHLKALQGKTSL